MKATSSNAEERNDDEGEFVVRLKDGTPYDEVNSGLQKMVRRGREREALVLALGLYDSGYGLALSRRLPIIAAEDIGLAAPSVVAQVCQLCQTWMTLKKEDPKRNPDALFLAMAVMLLCGSPKNREVDDACEVIREQQKRGVGDRPTDVIERYRELIVDCHTRRGRNLLRKTAAEKGVRYEQLAFDEFYRNGAQLFPLQQLQGNPYGHEAYRLIGLDYDQVVESAPKR